MKIKKGNINLENTLLSGQAFRVNKEDDGSFTIILFDRVINIKEDNNYLVISSSKEENLLEIVNNYLDINTSYETINNELINVDNTLREIIDFNKGYKILRQDKFEMLISYIISQNNNVKRISKSIDLISFMYGEKVIFNNKQYYMFPTFEQLKDITLEDLRSCGVGFRDNYIINALNVLKERPSFLDELNCLSSEDAMEELMKIKGIGKKVASCILLFGYARFDVFPVDTWVKKCVNERYKIKNDIEAISSFMLDKFGSNSGLLIQYLFNYERNHIKN